MRWWRAGLLAGCMTALTLVCLGVLVSGLWLNGDIAPSAEGIAETQPLNRLVVIREDGNVVTIAPDGSDEIQLTDDASVSRSYLYPTWSPDATTVAFVELLLAGSDAPGTSALHLSSADATSSRRVPTETPPFYLYWSPTSETLAFLSSWSDGIALRMVDVAGRAEEPTTVSQGEPFYFSWEPTGQTMLAHIGSDELTFLDRAGKREPLDVTAGRFQAPHWSQDGQWLAYVEAGSERDNVLNVSRADGDSALEIESRTGGFAFNWSPDSRQLAYSFTEQPVGLAAFGPLWVRDVISGMAWELSKEPVVAFFWSPDGRKLAFLRPERHEPVQRVPEASPLRQSTQLWLRWHIWDGERTYPLAIFAPSEPFTANYVVYFDQYAQSVSLWSPDSQSLLFAGLSESGRTGIWTVAVEEGSIPGRVTPGVIAAWSPR